jgi:hypothetical protein
VTQLGGEFLEELNPDDYSEEELLEWEPTWIWRK